LNKSSVGVKQLGKMSVEYFRNETFDSGSFSVLPESVTGGLTAREGGDAESLFQEPSLGEGDDKDELDSENNETENEQKEKETCDDIISPRQLYLGRLKRRTLLISEIRKAYLRDIVLLKHLLHEYLTHEDRLSILSQWEKSIPSLDLRQHFMIYSPSESSLDVLPCETCGGSVEIVHHDSSEIQELSKALSHLDKNKNELRLMIAKKNLMIENLEMKNETDARKHKEEVSWDRKARQGTKKGEEERRKANSLHDSLHISLLPLTSYSVHFMFCSVETLFVFANERVASE
jgi:hypothetical protein